MNKLIIIIIIFIFILLYLINSKNKTENFENNNFDLKFNGQAEQDKFILNVLNFKEYGYFIELGSARPIQNNNTFILEDKFNWKGIMVEYDKKYLNEYKKYRKNSFHIIGDATKINYKKVFDNNNIPRIVDYLQIDLDADNGSTLKTLELFDSFIFNDYKFSVITFEHDVYQDTKFNTRVKSREIFKKHGYYCVFEDIHDRVPKIVYEDWYVNPNLVDMEYIYKLKKINENNYVKNKITKKSIDWNNIEYPKRDLNNYIPKIYHQTWKTDELENDSKKNSIIIKKLYPEYKYILWTDKQLYNFIKKKFNNYYNFFMKLTKIQKIDIVRYFWMYYYGGVYSDLDIRYSKKINFENYQGVVFFEREWTYPEDKNIRYSVHNCIFASSAKHPIWLIIIDEIEKKYKSGIRNVFNLTGPNSISDIITRLNLKDKFKDLVILPGSYLYQKNFSKKYNKNNSYVTHLCYGSWN